MLLLQRRKLNGCKKISWEQIKELAEIAIKNKNDFSLTLWADGDCSLDISKHDYRITPTIPTPTITFNDSLTLVPTNIRDVPV